MANSHSHSSAITLMLELMSGLSEISNIALRSQKEYISLARYFINIYSVDIHIGSNSLLIDSLIFSMKKYELTS